MEDDVTPTTARLVTTPGKKPIYEECIADKKNLLMKYR